MRVELIDAARALVRAQPAMIPLLRLANNVLWAIDPLDDLAGARSRATSACADFVAQVPDAQSRIARHALETIPAQASILTHSFSSTVLEALLQAFRKGRLRQVRCTESGPQMEGKLLVARLAAEGIEAQAIVDMAAPGMVAQVDFIWVGADGLSQRGLVNKIGTHALASAAQRQGVPIYTLCTTDKIAPEGYDSPPTLARSAPQVETIVELFDLTPLELISGAITEEGLLMPQAILEYMRRTPLHPTLRRASPSR